MVKIIYEAYEKDSPSIIIVEGKDALSHPAYIASSAIIKGSKLNAIIIQHSPQRKQRYRIRN